MCVIIHLRPKQDIPFDKLENACHNNWHSFGLIIHHEGKTPKDNRLEVIKEVPESGEIDPKKIIALLDKHRDKIRYLHLRHNTAGQTNMENCHPFLVHKHKGQEVYAMHNGTLHQYKSQKIGPTGGLIDDDTGASDTVNYINDVLKPFFEMSSDISHKLLKKIILNDFPVSGTNRLLLVSSDQGSKVFGNWKILRVQDLDGTEDKILVSNDDYFDKVIRGPEKDRREKAEQEKKTKSTFQSSSELHQIKDYSFGVKHGFLRLSESPVEILNDWEFYDRSSAIAVGYFTTDELEKIYESKSDCIALMDWVFTDYTKLYEEFKIIEEKHVRASKKIAELHIQIDKMKKEERVG